MSEADENVSNEEEKKYTDDQVQELADHVKAGDDSLNKLKIQNLDFRIDLK